MDCDVDGKNRYNLATITIDLEIRPEAYKTGGRSGQSNQRVTLTRSFYYDQKIREWKPLGDDPNAGGTAYRILSATRTFDNLTFNIRANFSFFVNNTLIL